MTRIIIRHKLAPLPRRCFQVPFTLLTAEILPSNKFRDKSARPYYCNN